MAMSNSLVRLDKRAYLLAAAAVMLLPCSARAVDGFNLPGSDYANFNAGSPLVCRNTCGGEFKPASVQIDPGTNLVPAPD
jgi:hypothetical protein